VAKEFSWHTIYIEGSGNLRVLATAEEIAEIRAANPHLCKHPDVELRDYRTSSGGWQRKDQCKTCGIATSQAKPRNKEIIVPNWDIDLWKNWEANCNEKRSEIEDDLIDRTANIEIIGYEYYEEYLRSAEWLKKRNLVLNRDDFVCQACLEEPATEVHHQTYDQIFDEFLFDLISVCRKCHERLHSKKIAAVEAARAKGAIT
jgi:hypothetical protein